MSAFIPSAFTDAGLQLPAIVLPAIVIGLIVISVALFLMGTIWGDYDVNGFHFTAGAVLVLAGLVAAVTVIMAVPFKTAYWHLYRATGVVEQITNVIDSGSGELSTSPVIRLAGIDRPIQVDDPRIMQLDGATLTLTCTMAWHYKAADTYSCSIYTIDAEVSR